VLVKPAKTISLETFMNENIDNLPAISQVLNINAKSMLRKEGLVELSSGSYYNKDTINDNKADGRLNVWRGFNVTVTIYNRKLFLQVDPCSRVIREETFLQTIEQDRRYASLEEISYKYKDHPILRKYGSPKIYRI
jgi:hypothetical protein